MSNHRRYGTKVLRETHGALARLPLQSPALPQGFAETFFYSEAPRAEEETIDEEDEAGLGACAGATP